MKQFHNSEFLDSKGVYYVNPKEFDKGFIVARAFSPRSHIEYGKEISGWLPEILICEGSKNAPVRIQGSSIVAKNPAKSYVVQFNPWFDEEKEKKMIYTFKNSFKEQADAPKNLRDVNAIFHDTNGYYDNQLRPGEISYSSISNRDLVFHGDKNELEKMVLLTLNNFPVRGFDLKYGEYTANGKSEYKIEIPEIDRTFFVKEISKRVLN
jgi:hypothetical protein